MGDILFSIAIKYIYMVMIKFWIYIASFIVMI
jgi:hypothetical protein